MSIWTDEISNDLAARIANGETFRHIGAELSSKYRINVSKNACISRAGRLGVKSTRKPGETNLTDVPKVAKPKRAIRIKQSTERRQVIVVRRMNGNSDRMKLVQSSEFVEPRRLKCVEVEPLHLTLMQLEPNSCRYPYGEDEITFCGHPRCTRIVGTMPVLRPYCAPHCAVAFAEPRPHNETYIPRKVSRFAS